MGPKKCSEDNKMKRKAVRATIEVKKDLIARHEGGTRVADLAAIFGMPKSTVCTILKNKEAIKAADVAKGVTTLTSRRSKCMEEMEKLLLVWINQRQLAGDVISEAMLCEKAKMLHDDLAKGLADTSAQKDEFKASRGWLENFKKRTGGAVIHAEPTRSHSGQAERFHSENSVNSVVSDEAYSDGVSIKEEDVSDCTARTDMAMISPGTPEMDPATRVINNVANHRKRSRQEHRDPYELTWRDHKNYLGEATVPEPAVPNRSAAQVFFESCALRMEKLSPRHQSFLQLQVSQLLFNAENPDVTPLAIIPLPRHQPSEKFHKDTTMIERDQRD
ncbi:unnamed protein product [Lymnaea stagnalis]|uniref:HTH CENPB-type domain-containing protein n=1 Tax=Lymnaea stagnalis TaxID=6523 RepID=A0AAV2GYL7_LYMST